MLDLKVPCTYTSNLYHYFCHHRYLSAILSSPPSEKPSFNRPYLVLLPAMVSPFANGLNHPTTNPLTSGLNQCERATNANGLEQRLCWTAEKKVRVSSVMVVRTDESMSNMANFIQSLKIQPRPQRVNKCGDSYVIYVKIGFSSRHEMTEVIRRVLNYNTALFNQASTFIVSNGPWIRVPMKGMT